MCLWFIDVIFEVTASG